MASVAGIACVFEILVRVSSLRDHKPKTSRKQIPAQWTSLVLLRTASAEVSYWPLVGVKPVFPLRLFFNPLLIFCSIAHVIKSSLLCSWLHNSARDLQAGFHHGDLERSCLDGRGWGVVEVPGPVLERHLSSCEYESISVHFSMILGGDDVFDVGAGRVKS